MAATVTEPLLLNADEAAALLGVPGGRRSIYKLVDQHQLPAVRIGERRMYFRRAALEAWIEEREG